MSNLLFPIKTFAKFKVKTLVEKNASPIITDFIEKVLNDDRYFYAFKDIVKLHGKLLTNNKIITVTDFGAGSQTSSSPNRKIKDIAKKVAKQPKWGKVLFRIVNHYKPKSILELGTSLGISSLYLALPDKRNKLITLEGCPEIAKIAKNNFEDMGLKNTSIIVGNFDNTLPAVLESIDKLDLVFIDGNHRKEPTINYFEQCLKYAHPDTIFIFDDIHWSPEMDEAWNYLINHNKVAITIDLFQLGIVFINKVDLKSKESISYHY